MSYIIFPLCIIDIIAGVTLITGLFNFILPYIALIVLIKGILSFFGSVGSGYVFDWMGVLDIVVGASMELTAIGMTIPFLPYLGYVIIFKSLYCVVRILVNV